MTPDEIEAAKQAAAAGGDKGAKDGATPTPEALKAAQDIAEKFRKEAEEVKERLEEKETELEELNEKARLSDADKKRKALLEAGIDDDAALIAEFDAEAKKGVRWAKAVKAEIQKTTRELATEIAEKVISKHDLERDFEARDEWVEETAEERSEPVKEFKAKIGKYADDSLKGSPKKQAKIAYVKFLEHEKMEKEKSDWDEKKRADANFRDPGSSQSGDQSKSGKPDFTKDWRSAKTPREKELALHDI